MSPFPSVRGHASQRGHLWRAISNDRLHHALLIQGPRGVGKRTLAQVVARTLLCEEPAQGPCEKCATCHKTKHGHHPDIAGVLRDDIVGIDPALQEARDDRFEKGKAVIGDVLDVAYLTALGAVLDSRPFEARRRVVIIVDAERMNPSAANKLLKSLEEPCPGNVAILTSSSPASLLPTIRSRCAVLRVGGLAQAEVEDALVQMERVDRNEAHRRAQLCGGSLGRALEEQTDPGDELRNLLVRALGDGPDAALSSWLAAEMASEGKGSELRPAVLLLGTMLRDIAVLRVTGDASRLINQDASPALTRLAASPLDVDRIWQSVKEMPLRIAGQANPLLLWDAVLQGAR